MPHFEKNTSSSRKFFTKLSCVVLPSQMIIYENSYKFYMLSPLNILFTNFEVGEF